MPTFNRYKSPMQGQKRANDINVLVVDDQVQMRDMLRLMLKKNRYASLNIVESCKRALMMFSGQPVDLLITDWNMPNMTGIELLKHIKNHPKLFSVPVVMLSDAMTTDNVLYAFEEGVDGFLLKPFSENDLTKKINLALTTNTSKGLIGKKIFEMRQLKLSKRYSEALALGLELLDVVKNPRVALMTCECLYHVEEYDKVISMMADTEEENKSSQHVNLMGKIHLKLGQFNQGIVALEQSVRMNPLNQERKIDLAEAYFVTGDIEKAEKLIQNIGSSNPTDLELVGLAQLYLDQGSLEKAGAYLKQTVDPIKDTVHVFNNYAVALPRADRLEEATEIYLKCLKIDPESDLLHYNVAVLYFKSNKLKEAKEALVNALKLNPENLHAKDLLQKINAA